PGRSTGRRAPASGRAVEQGPSWAVSLMGRTNTCVTQESFQASPDKISSPDLAVLVGPVAENERTAVSARYGGPERRCSGDVRAGFQSVTSRRTRRKPFPLFSIFATR